MKKIAIVICCFTILLTGAAVKAQSAYEIMARHFAEDYYTGLLRIAESASRDEPELINHAKEIEIQLYKLIGNGEMGLPIFLEMRVPNDIDKIFDSKTNPKETIAIPNYFGRFSDYATQYKFCFNYELVSCKQLDTPSMQEYAGKRYHYVDVVVKKKYRWNRKTTRVKETMCVGFEGNSVFLINIK